MKKEKEIYEMVKKFAVTSCYPKFQKYDIKEVYESYGWIAACEALAKEIKAIEEKHEHTEEKDLLERYKRLEKDYFEEAQECHKLRKELIKMKEELCSLQKEENTHS